MEKILLLDSNSLMDRAFYAIPSLSTNEGEHTNAIYGFMNVLLEIKAELNPQYIMAAFNKGNTTFRTEILSQYNNGIEDITNELSSQIDVIKDILQLMNVDICEIDGFEAKDIIGTVSKECEKEVYIVTADRNLLQLISNNINVILLEKGINQRVTYDTTLFSEEFKISPKQYIDVKALMGDKDNNVEPIPTVGEKTALKLISEYGSLEEVLNNISKISGNTLQRNIEKYKEEAILSKKIAVIREDVPLKDQLKEYSDIVEENKIELKNILNRLQLKSILSKLPDIAGDSTEEVECKSIEYIEVNNIELMDTILNEETSSAFILYDIINKNKYSKIEIEKVYLSMNDKSYAIDLKVIMEKDKEKAIKSLKAFMENEKISKVIHEAKEFITALSKYDIVINNFIFDTSIGAYLINSARGDYEIKSLLQEYLDEEINGDDVQGRCHAVSLISKLYEEIRNKIINDDMEKLYYEVEHPLISVLSNMESIGFKVDKSILDSLAVKFKEEIASTEKAIYELCEEEFNIGSPKQLGKILFEKLDLPVIKKTKTGYSTNAEVLEKLSDKHPVIEKIIYYRQITKLNSTYVEGLKNVIDEDGNIHSSFNQTVTTTGRLSSTEPNLQNIPIKYEMGREIRKVFIPMESTDVLLSCDYSQIELRVLADMSKDENMIDAFKHHSDIHTKTASEVFKVPVEEVTSTMRGRAKAVNFGIVYGMSDFSLAQDLKITKKEAGEYMAIYFDRYPKIKEFLSSAIDEAKENGYVLTVLNRRRFIAEIKSSNKIVQALGERLAMNAPIQGSAADIIKLAMVKVFNRLEAEKLNSKIILQVHDELILNVKKDELETVKQLVIEEMQKAFNLAVPLDVDANIGNNWYEAK